MPLIPFKNKVTIYPLSDPDKTESGLFIPDIAKTRTDQGVVAAIGGDVKDVKPGDYVLYSAYAGQLVIIEGTKYIIMVEDDLVAIVNDEFSNQQVPGLYFRSRDGEFFPATYTQSIQLIASHFGNDKVWDKFARGVTQINNEIIKEPIRVKIPASVEKEE